MSKKILPVGHRVLVRKREVENTLGKEVKFHKPESMREKDEHQQCYGTVIAVSEAAYIDVYAKPQCGVGDEVVFRAYAGVRASEEDEDLILLNDQDILAVTYEEEDES